MTDLIEIMYDHILDDITEINPSMARDLSHIEEKFDSVVVAQIRTRRHALYFDAGQVTLAVPMDDPTKIVAFSFKQQVFVAVDTDKVLVLG